MKALFGRVPLLVVFSLVLFQENILRILSKKMPNYSIQRTKGFFVLLRICYSSDAFQSLLALLGMGDF